MQSIDQIFKDLTPQIQEVEKPDFPLIHTTNIIDANLLCSNQNIEMVEFKRSDFFIELPENIEVIKGSGFFFDLNQIYNPFREVIKRWSGYKISNPPSPPSLPYQRYF